MMNYFKTIIFSASICLLTCCIVEDPEYTSEYRIVNNTNYHIMTFFSNKGVYSEVYDLAPKDSFVSTYYNENSFTTSFLIHNDTVKVTYNDTVVSWNINPKNGERFITNQDDWEWEKISKQYELYRFEFTEADYQLALQK